MDHEITYCERIAARFDILSCFSEFESWQKSVQIFLATKLTIVQEKPVQEKPVQEKPVQEKPVQVFPVQVFAILPMFLNHVGPRNTSKFHFLEEHQEYCK